MGHFRFRKRIRFFPGVWVNLSKRAASVSVGGHGVTANISPKGVRDTFSVPGTGLSYQTERVGMRRRQGPSRRNARRRSASPGHVLAFIFVVLVILWILGSLH